MCRLAFSLFGCLLPTLALAAPPERYFENDKGSILHVTQSRLAGFDFTLKAGGPVGALF